MKVNKLRRLSSARSMGFLNLLTQASEALGAPGRPPKPSVGLPGASGGLPEETNQSKKTSNRKDLIKQWRNNASAVKKLPAP